MKSYYDIICDLDCSGIQVDPPGFQAAYQYQGLLCPWLLVIYHTMTTMATMVSRILTTMLILASMLVLQQGHWTHWPPS